MSGPTRPATQTPATEPPQLLRECLKSALTLIETYGDWMLDQILARSAAVQP